MHLRRAVALTLVLALLMLLGAWRGRADQLAKPQWSDSTGALFVTVRDSITGKPIEAASVGIRKSKRGGASDHRGQVRITQIPVGRRILFTTSLAYHDKSDSIDVRAGRCDSVVVVLRRYKHFKIVDCEVQRWD